MTRKIKATTDNSGWVEPKKKVRKKRKPMTEKQRVAAAKRLEKAREARKKKNPDYGMTGIHESLRNLPEEHPAHPKKIKHCIKTQKELANEERAGVRQGLKGAYARQSNHEGYVRNLLRYLRDGDYVDDFYGEYQQHFMKRRCVALAYDENGNVKRNVGVYYPDMGSVYTQEMNNEDRGIKNANVQKTKRKQRKRSKRAVA